jgi:hypothetical protein
MTAEAVGFECHLQILDPILRLAPIGVAVVEIIRLVSGLLVTTKRVLVPSSITSAL